MTEREYCGAPPPEGVRPTATCVLGAGHGGKEHRNLEGDRWPVARLTPARHRALEIVRDAGERGIRPREFAKAMWPDSPGWQRHSRSGPKGAHRGGGMYLTGGAFLGRLQQDGLTKHNYAHEYDTSHSITQKGLDALEGKS